MAKETKAISMAERLGIDVAKVQAILARSGYYDRPLHSPETAEIAREIMEEMEPLRAAVNRKYLDDADAGDPSRSKRAQDDS